MPGARPFAHRRRLFALLPLCAVTVAAMLPLVSCGSPASKEDASSTVTAKAEDDAVFPLVIDGDRLGVSSLDGNPPVAVSEPGYIDGVAYDREGRLIYVQHSGRMPGFYRVEEGVPRLAIQLARGDPSLPAKWSPDGSQAAWIGADGPGYGVAVAAPEQEPRRIGPGGVKDFLWSPDGSRIVAWEGWDSSEVSIIDAVGGDSHSITLNGFPIAWASSGDLIIWEKTGERNDCLRSVVTVRPDGGERHHLGGIRLCTEGGPSEFSSLSRDGQWLAWSRVADSEGKPEMRVVVAATDGSTIAHLECLRDCSPQSSGSDPAWSPDGRQIAWSQDGHILVADAGVWEGRVVADGYQPIWSPDGSEIAYFRTAGDRGSLVARTLDDGAEVKVLDIDTVWMEDQIAWSPDGRQLTVPLQAADRSDVFSLDLQTGDLQRLAIDIGTASSPSLARDGSAVVYYGPEGWTVTGFDGKSQTTHPAESGDTCQDWSRDVSRFLCAGRSGVYTLETSSGRTVAVTTRGAESAAWSPDETAIAFAFSRTLNVLDIATGMMTQIATGLQGNPAPYYYQKDSYAWSPDGRRIAFTNWRPVDSSANPGASTISIVGADGASLRQLSESPGFKTDLVFSPDSRHLAFMESTGRLVVLDVTSGKQSVEVPNAYAEPTWADDSSLVVSDLRGVTIVRLDGSEQLLLAVAGGCSQMPIGWSEGRLFFTNSCSHQGY